MKKILSMLLVLALMFSVMTGCGSTTEKAQETSKEESTSGAAETKEDTAAEKKDETKDDAAVASENEPVVIRIAWWGNPTRDEATNLVLDMYTELNPHVTFEAEPLGWGGYWDKLGTQAAAGSLPDIIAQDYSKIAAFIDAGQLADLSSFVGSELDLSDVADSVIASGTIDGGLYGIPLGMNSLAFAYNAELLAQAGIDSIDSDWTWDDYYTMIAQVQEKTGLQSDVPFFPDPKFWLEYLVRQDGERMFSDDGKSLGFSGTSQLVEMFTKLQENIDAGNYPRPEELVNTGSMAESLFVNDMTVISNFWSNQFVAFTDLMPEKDVKMINLPYNDAGVSGHYIKPSMFFSVTETSEVKSEAAKFIDFWTNNITANKVLKADRGVPVAAAVRDGIADNVAASTAATFDYVALCAGIAQPIDPPEPGNAAEMTALLKNYTEQIAYGMMTPQEAADAFYAEANEILSK